MVDWQTLGVGLPRRDLAYFTATSLLPAARAPSSTRNWSTAYHEELLGYGVTDYDRETCWRDYRLGMLQAPLLTALGCAFASSTERGDEMMLVMLERGCQAIRELGSLDTAVDQTAQTPHGARAGRPPAMPTPARTPSRSPSRTALSTITTATPRPRPHRASAASCRRRCSW